MANSENPELTIIILNYNVKELLLNCLDSVFASKQSLPSKDGKAKLDRWQVIVVDNASEDGSVEAVKERYKGHYDIEILENKENLGFAAGNNVGVEKAKAPVILFLNPDTVIKGHAIQKSLEVLLSDPDIGALGCRVELPDGRLDYSCHRGFPTPWNSFAYFSGLAKRFPRSPLFSGYSATYLDTNKSHEIDCVTGAFLMVRKIAGDQINWWDRDYFWNGEDIEFCFSLKEKGWKIFYYPEVKIIHHKGSSAKKAKVETITHGISAMRIFYKKHYYKNYPLLFRDIVLWGIKLLEHYRKFKIMTGLRYE
ncbi:MAG: glycosyltransferase family 2 protein [Candidatus Daviesbacteria bacterium]|nr:glycosyltransferase family 2 protein [Candidatus Daviesbacteria bacterium]